MRLHDGNAGLHGSLTSVPNDYDLGPDLLNVAEAAGWLNISIAGMRSLQQRRLIAFIKLGGRVRFAKRDLASYVERCRVESVGQ